jgi:thiamine-phosphate pyrophosphorylase
MRNSLRDTRSENARGGDENVVRGLYAITPETSDAARLERDTAAVIAGGARLVQYRNKTGQLESRRLQARLLRALCHANGVPLIVNDDIELARDVEADGVHLGKDDGSLEAARALLGPAALIGVSCYGDLDRALDAQSAGASYVAFGSFYASSVKPGAVRAPIELLREARAVLRIPIVAIGGITADNALPLIRAGADAVAVISALFDCDDPQAAAQTFARLFATLSQPSRSTSIP